jgi:hypothetical protein
MINSMFFLSHSSRRTFLMITILVFMAVGSLNAQENGTKSSAQSTLAETSIQQWIVDLGSSSFKTRLDASRHLQTAGDVAIEPLIEAIRDATGESKLRMESILRDLQRSSLTGRLAALENSPKAENATGLPEWERFAKTVGNDEASIQLYVRLLKAEPKLFTAAVKSSTELSNLLEVRSAELMHTTRSNGPQKLSNPFSVDSYAAVLFLAGNESTRLVRGTSTQISALLRHRLFVKELGGADKNRLQQLAGDYILRERIGVSVPLQFARANPMPQGLILARRVIKTALRGENGLHAMMLLKEQGGEQDIALLESVFDNKGILFQNNLPNGLKARPQDFSVVNGDLALAVAIALRDNDPRDFGFAKDYNRNTKLPFTFETIGFASEADRAAAHEMYAAKFLAK